MNFSAGIQEVGSLAATAEAAAHIVCAVPPEEAGAGT